ncbi:family 43 glycosylhydrolase [Spirosoma luteolum]
MPKPSIRLLPFVVLTAGLLLLGSQTKAQQLPIRNDVFWYTTDKRPINSQGGGVFRFTDPSTGKQKYYWYGVHYREADTYRANPAVTLPNATFEAVTCYSSTDLVNWTFENNVLTKAALSPHEGGKPTWVGRLGVAYIESLHTYALFVQHGNEVLISTASSPTGQFAWHQQISMKSMIGTSNTGDQTVFTDEDTGKSYLIYSYGNGRNRIYVSEIGVKDGMVNLLDCKQVFQGESREGNCLFKYRGKFYMCASNIYGWDASYAYYLVADDIRGPYTPTNHMLVMNGCADDYAHVTQTGFFYTVKGTRQETVVYCGDRWANFAGNGLGYNHWFPLSFDGGTPYFNSIGAWQLNARTGEWRVGADNNYVKNGSFEADRKAIPSPVKPEQTQLTGWTTTIISGNAISLDPSTSPVLNYSPTEQERAVVIGEKCLAIRDNVAFRRKVSQTIRSSPYVTLENGRYTLTAKIRNSRFTKLVMYATTNGKTVSYPIETANADWLSIRLESVDIRQGEVEIGFLADGMPGAFCYVDDVTLVRAR